MGSSNVRRYEKKRYFQPISRFFSEMIQYRAIFTVPDQYEVVHDLSNDAICSDLEQALTRFSRLRLSLTLDISQMAKDTAIDS